MPNFRRSKNHQGTPFIAVTIDVSFPRNLLDLAGDFCQVLRLDRDYDVVLRPGVRRSLTLEGLDFAARAVAHAQALLADRFELRAARDDRDVVPGTRQPGGDQTTDRAGAVNADFHGVILG